MTCPVCTDKLEKNPELEYEGKQQANLKTKKHFWNGFSFETPCQIQMKFGSNICHNADLATTNNENDVECPTCIDKLERHPELEYEGRPAKQLQQIKAPCRHCNTLMSLFGEMAWCPSCGTIRHFPDGVDTWQYPMDVEVPMPKKEKSFSLSDVKITELWRILHSLAITPAITFDLHIREKQ